MRRAIHALAGVAAALFAVSGCKKETPSPEVIVAAAASLRGVMPAIVTAYGAQHAGAHVTVTYGASGDLRQQVEGGAPIDVVFFASAKTVDDLVKAHLADPTTRKVVATNALVLIGPKGGAKYTFATVDTVPASEKIAIGNPRSVPAGQYAETALRGMGKWDAIQSHLVLAGDVSGVLAYVQHAEVSAGIVYKTEVHGVTDVVVLDEVSAGPPGTRPEVVAAVTTGSKAPADARSFLDYVASPPSEKLLADFGFGPP